MYKVTKEELLRDPETGKRRDIEYSSEYTTEIDQNIDTLLVMINKVRDRYNIPMIVASGWRPAAINAGIKGAATHSKHMMGQAVDIRDVDGKLRQWVLDNLQWLSEVGFYFEDFRWTSGWVHFQIVPPHSKSRIFIPYAERPPHPDLWNGQYDQSLNY